MSFEFVDRYTGRPYPNPWTCCKGGCEGLGEKPSGICPECEGTGRRVEGRFGYYLDVLHTYYYQLWWPLWAMWFTRKDPASQRPLTYWFRFIAGEQRKQRMTLRRQS